ncbi:MAG: ABC transporter ATP-binding protein [bacterium]
MTPPPAAVVQVEDLTIDFRDRQAWVNVVNGVFFRISPGETLGLAGESGCGKSTTAYALFGYRRPGSRIQRGVITFAGQNILGLSERELRRIRGAEMCLVPQNPASALTPSMRVAHQIIEILEAHGVSPGIKEAEERAIDLLAQVGLPRRRAIARSYPHQLSGGQQQRVAIAMALACQPKLLVLDEPTTALDVTTQARILALLGRLKAEHGMSMLYVTHNLGVLAQVCDRVAVMYAGELVEVAPTAELFRNPRHPYTRGLIATVPRLSAPNENTLRLRGSLRRTELPRGCRFAPRCDFARPECFTRPQALEPVAPDHHVACWLWRSIAPAERAGEAGRA